MFEYDLEHIAREAMTKDAQLRMTSEGFPQELRLQVMRASVMYHASTFSVDSGDTEDEFLLKELTTSFYPQPKSDNITDAAASLFDTQHTVGALHDTLKELAEQALFKATIFKVYKYFFRARENKNAVDSIGCIAPLIQRSGKHVQHLELVTHLLPANSYQHTLMEAMDIWTLLKHQCPTLKACVFTLAIRTSSHRMNSDISRGVFSVDDCEAKFPAALLQRRGEQNQSLGSTIGKLFAEFAEEGPGARRFIRIQHLQCDHVPDIMRPQYGPLVTVHSAISEAQTHGDPKGADLLAKAYRLERTGETIEVEPDTTRPRW